MREGTSLRGAMAAVSSIPMRSTYVGTQIIRLVRDY